MHLLPSIDKFTAQTLVRYGGNLPQQTLPSQAGHLYHDQPTPKSYPASRREDLNLLAPEKKSSGNQCELIEGEHLLLQTPATHT